LELLFSNGVISPQPCHTAVNPNKQSESIETLLLIGWCTQVKSLERSKDSGDGKKWQVIIIHVCYKCVHQPNNYVLVYISIWTYKSSIMLFAKLQKRVSPFQVLQKQIMRVSVLRGFK
jgi:hypothetical protein